MQNKEDIIKIYLFAICARHPKVDKESLLQIWLQEFDYLDEKEEYLISFMVACRQVINDSSMFRLPSPDDIKRIITENLKPKTTKVDKVDMGMTPEFKKGIWDKWSALFGKAEKTAEEEKKFKELTDKMKNMAKGAR